MDRGTDYDSTKFSHRKERLGGLTAEVLTTPFQCLATLHLLRSSLVGQDRLLAWSTAQLGGSQRHREHPPSPSQPPNE